MRQREKKRYIEKKTTVGFLVGPRGKLSILGERETRERERV